MVKTSEAMSIIVAILAVFGAYSILDMLRTNLLYPRRVRRSLRAAMVLPNEADAIHTAQYAAYLRREQKISRGRLIILANDDIINVSDELSRLGEVYYFKRKEEVEYAGRESGRQEP